MLPCKHSFLQSIKKGFEIGHHSTCTYFCLPDTLHVWDVLSPTLILPLEMPEYCRQEQGYTVFTCGIHWVCVLYVYLFYARELMQICWPPCWSNLPKNVCIMHRAALIYDSEITEIHPFTVFFLIFCLLVFVFFTYSLNACMQEYSKYRHYSNRTVENKSGFC